MSEPINPELSLGLCAHCSEPAVEVVEVLVDAGTDYVVDEYVCEGHLFGTGPQRCFLLAPPIPLAILPPPRRPAILPPPS